jgi:4-amino-4-deoxy-L-arabinose transferase-like glycosyltransferase
MLRPVLCILLYVVLATVYLERWPVPDFDEGLYANPALNLIQKGNFGSSAMSGVLDLGRVTFWFLPLHSLLLWLPIKLLGFHVWAVRLFSVVCGLLTLLALYKLARSLGVGDKAATLLVLFMGTDFMFLEIARRSRMEALLCFFHVTLLLLLIRAHQTGRSWSYFVLDDAPAGNPRYPRLSAFFMAKVFVTGVDPEQHAMAWKGGHVCAGICRGLSSVSRLRPH